MKIGKKIINQLIKNKEVISATIVGSYSEKKKLEHIGDLDVVVICKKLNKNIYFNIKKNIENLKFKKKFIINSTFGPVKIGSKKVLPIHLMVYDLNLHKQHVLASPFTCYDWERSRINRGIPLKKIFPIRNLQLNDFFNSRRSSQEYLKDINRNRISIRKYKFQGKKVLEKKEYIKIDPRNRGEFVYHIINFLVINLYKFFKRKNIRLSEKIFNNFFLRITGNDTKLLKKFNILKDHKVKKNLSYNINTIFLAQNFIKKYNRFLDNIKKDYIELNFLRHAKTRMNKKKVFLGIRNDPSIAKIDKKKISKIKYDFIIVSQLKRSKLTAKFFRTKKILTNNLVNEIDYGEADGMSYTVFKKKYPHIIKSWKMKKDIKFPKGEKINDVKIRILKFFKYLNKFKTNSKILIISHSFFLRTLFAFVFNINLKTAYKIKIDHLKNYQFIKKGNTILPNFSRTDQEKIYRQVNG